MPGQKACRERIACARCVNDAGYRVDGDGSELISTIGKERRRCTLVHDNRADAWGYAAFEVESHRFLLVGYQNVRL
jgi:hypothetical protein